MSFRRLKFFLLAGFGVLIGGFCNANANGDLASMATRVNAAQVKLSGADAMSLEELSKTALELENVLGEMRDVEREYGAKRNEVEAKFRDQSQELSQILGYMATLRSAPAPDFLLHPEGASGSIEANILVEMILPQFEEKLKGIADELTFWREINQSQSELSASTVIAIEGINKIRSKIITRDRSGIPQNLISDPEVVEKIAAVSKDLSEFTKGLEQMPRSIKNADLNLSKNQIGQWDYPAKGDIRRYLDGEIIATNQSVIASPVAGTIRFAAKFPNYGQMIIIEPDKGYLLILSGFDQIVVLEGEVLHKGDILGFFATKTAQSEENSELILAKAKHDLYVELRKDGKAVKPSDYFVSGKS